MREWLTADAANWQPTAWWLGDLAIRATLIFAATVVVTRLMRRTSAAARHFVWLAAFVGAGTLPLVSTTLPSWHWSLGRGTHIATQAPSIEVDHFARAANARPWTDEATASTAPWTETLLATHAAEAAAPIVAPAHTFAPADTPWPWAPIFVTVWAMGALAMLIPLCIGALSLAQLGRRARPVSDDRLLRIFGQSMLRLECRRSVRLLESEARQVPMTWGMFRPAVLLPSSARSWSDAQLQMVLLHELAHVVRADCATQWLVQACRAMYWYHPLAWFAYGRLRVEQEQACDDRVLSHGCEAADYAEHLVAVAAGLAPRRWAAAVALAMADQTRMERRVTAILDEQSNRRSLTTRSTFAWLAAAAAVVVPVASFTATPKPVQAGLPVDAVARSVERAIVRQEAAPAKEQDGATATGALAELQEHVTRRYVTAPDEMSLVRGAMRGMVEALNDPYSEVMSAEALTQLERQIKGALTGIGAQLEMRAGRPTVLTPLENSPALKAGVRPGDVIVEIDGQAAAENLQQVAARIMGAADSTVKLLLQRGDGSRTTLEIQRAAFKVPTVQGYQRNADGAWDYTLDATHKIAYVRITQFGAETAEELRSALAASGDLKGLVLDLRFCPGGLMAQSIDVVRQFAPTGEIVTLRGRDGSEQRIGEGEAPQEPRLPTVVLVNEMTASSAEIVSGALQANHCAIVVGSRTHGKASVQELVRLEDGTGIRLTTAFYHLPNGRNIHKRLGEKTWGVDPDEGYFVPMSAQQSEKFLRSLRDRERLDAASPQVAAKPSLDDAAFQHLDPQLTAGWRAMVHRLTDGKFKPTGRTAAELQSYVAQRELAAQRGELVTKLEQVSRELRELDSAIGDTSP